MGMYETIFNLTQVLDSQSFDIVLNIGVCGYVSENKNRIQVARTVNMTTWKELIVPVFVEFGNLESIGCSEKVIKNGADLWNYMLNYGDMESRWIEYVCDKFRVPRVILKVPVDQIGEEEFDREKAGKLLRQNLDYITIIKKLLEVNQA
jgi:nucleoside phosphorylase